MAIETQRTLRLLLSSSSSSYSRSFSCCWSSACCCCCWSSACCCCAATTLDDFFEGKCTNWKTTTHTMQHRITYQDRLLSFQAISVRCGGSFCKSCQILTVYESMVSRYKRYEYNLLLAALDPSLHSQITTCHSFKGQGPDKWKIKWGKEVIFQSFVYC